MILSIHIPKTAGTTFRELLQRHFREAICLHYYHPMDYTGRPLSEVPSVVECIHGHFGAQKFLSCYFDADLVTWLRDPIERVVSEYEHLKRSPDPDSGLSQLISRGASLIEFAEHPYARDTQTRYFDGVDAARFAFVGVSEKFDLELERFQEVTGIALPKGHRVNVNPAKKAQRYTVSSFELAKLEQLNAQDVELYGHFAQKLFPIPMAS
jgi:hypothetical protein